MQKILISVTFLYFIKTAMNLKSKIKPAVNKISGNKIFFIILDYFLDFNDILLKHRK